MQAALKFFDFPFKGTGEQGVHKIGIKLPERSAENCLGDETGFMEILAALTRIPPRELTSSLALLDWVPVADDTGELAPLIDLTGQGDSDLSLMEMLLSGGDGDSPPSMASDGLPAPNLIPKTDAPVSEATLSLQDTVAALETSSEGQSTPSHGTPPAQNPELWTPPAASRFQAIESVGTTMDPASNASQRAARFILTDPAADRATTAPSPENRVSTATGAGILSDGTKRAPSARVTPEFDDGKERAHTPTADGRTQMSRLGTAEPPIAPEVASRQERFALQAPQQSGAKGSEPAAEPILAQGVGAPASASARDQRFGQTVRIENPSVRQDGGIPMKPVEGEKMQSNTPSNREGTPSFDSQLTNEAPKAVEAESAAKEVMPFIEKDTHTDVIRQIVQRMTLRTEKQHSQMIIRLKPDFLGHVRLHVSTENQQVTVRMEAESAVVKDIIEQNMPHLKAELHQHGLQIEKFDVFVGNQNDGWQNGQHPTGFRQASKRNGETFTNNHAEDEPFDRSGNTGGQHSAYRGYRSSEVDYFA